MYSDSLIHVSYYKHKKKKKNVCKFVKIYRQSNKIRSKIMNRDFNFKFFLNIDGKKEFFLNTKKKAHL